jgi:2-amino-4-hydroxy-6-hydroxymethyldihydropteridine diphosphokinase
MRAEVYIGLGSNLDDPALQIQNAISALEKLPESRLTKTAPWYQSQAIGPGVQDDYINTVAAITTALSPHRLLQQLQAIENQQCRKRIIRWGPRTIDLDILLYDQQVINATNLVIPHPRLSQRNFVLYPLADIAPELILPDKTPLQELLANTCAKGIVRLDAGEILGSTG